MARLSGYWRFRMCAATLLTALAATAGIRAQDADEGIEAARAAAHFREAKALSDADGGTLWGQPLYGPMMFVDRISRAIVANQPDAGGRLTKQGAVFSGTLPDDHNMANTATTWSGVRWTMLIWPPPQQRYTRGKLLTHEMFHRIQDQLGLSSRDAENSHLDSRDGRIWLRLEWRALSEALIRREPARHNAIVDALTFRRYRRTLFPDRVADERALELNEGLAEYTGFKAGGLPAHVLADRAAIQLDDYEQRESFVRNFAYASGPAYGILLDEAGGATWRSQLGPDSDLGALLASACAVQIPTVQEAEAKQRARKYDGRQVIEEETRRDDQRKRRQAAYRARFLEGPTLTLPRVGEIRYSFNPNQVAALGEVGTVYLTTRVTDTWGVLEVDSGGALMIRNAGLVDRFIVPAPGDARARPLAGDGWTLILAGGWTLKPGERQGDWIMARTGE